MPLPVAALAKGFQLRTATTQVVKGVIKPITHPISVQSRHINGQSLATESNSAAFFSGEPNFFDRQSRLPQGETCSNVE